MKPFGGYYDDFNHTFRHTHFSSTAIRRMAGTSSNTDKTNMCPVCKALEPVTIPAADTGRVVLADSIMYGIWNHMKPSKFHFDIDSIVGGSRAGKSLDP